MANFTPLLSTIGGAMIGAAAILLWTLCGRIAGVSGIAAGLLPPRSVGATAQRIAFLAGLAAAPLAAATAGHFALKVSITAEPTLLAIGGLLVGFGAVLGSGCTSGHGVCGLSRLSKRSSAATLTFTVAAAVTVFLARHAG
jgi:uncharacterized membrane protein YedE/YeeE